LHSKFDVVETEDVSLVSYYKIERV
jgi:hypothetical protein